MAVLVLGSVKASPGVTTLAMALAATWPGRRVVLVEADPAGGDLAARLQVATGPGLVELAAAARRAARPELVWRHGQRLDARVWLVAAPVGAEQARAAVAALAASRLVAAWAADPQLVVVVDVGRVEPASVALPLLGQATGTLLVARPCVAELAHLGRQCTALSTGVAEVGLVLVGRGRFSAAEIAATLRVPVVAELPLDRRGAAALLAGEPAPQRAGRLRLGRAARSLAERLAASAGFAAPDQIARADRPDEAAAADAAGAAEPPKAWLASRPLAPQGPGRVG
ncbi:hypothetical protein [Actinomadura rupiterrae]|uniref:hypothetical protein n=1 Tax=Actinomadura rupiterrae TaxID=559627 RepID=UPI0020A4CB3F|nr:hypothetical protein [Actinomadura rupiterrae]MCP2335225.1 hypothetical protein [Actinomadura rupiterrae]